MSSKTSETFCTTFCNQAHRLSDGKPVQHNCFILPPSALHLEKAGDYKGASAAISAAKPLREIKRGTRK